MSCCLSSLCVLQVCSLSMPTHRLFCSVCWLLCLLLWTRVVSSTRTCPAYGVTDYYPFNSYRIWQKFRFCHSCHSCHNFRVPLFRKVHHNAGLLTCGFLSILWFKEGIETSLYALVYTLFLDNDKEMRIFRGLSKNVFLTRILDKKVWQILGFLFVFLFDELLSIFLVCTSGVFTVYANSQALLLCVLASLSFALDPCCV